MRLTLLVAVSMEYTSISALDAGAVLATVTAPLNWSNLP